MSGILRIGIAALLILICLVLIVTAVSEMNARDSAISTLSSDIEQVTKQSAATDKEDPNYLFYSDQYVRMAVAKRKIEFLAAMGASSSDYELDQILNSASQSPGPPSENKPFLRRNPLGQLSSDNLLIITIACCALLGVITNQLRIGDRLEPKQLLLGILSGAVYLFGIKGFAAIFLAQGAGLVTRFNPYTNCFFSFLCGMFSDRFFAILGDLFSALTTTLLKQQKSTH